MHTGGRRWGYQGTVGYCRVVLGTLGYWRVLWGTGGYCGYWGYWVVLGRIMGTVGVLRDNEGYPPVHSSASLFHPVPPSTQ